VYDVSNYVLHSWLGLDEDIKNESHKVMCWQKKDD
jgi:hypothetical protein